MIEKLFRVSEKQQNLFIVYWISQISLIAVQSAKMSNRVKKKHLNAPVLGYPNNRDPYTLTTDASLIGIGAILIKKQGMEDRDIAYASKTLSKS